MDSTRIHGIFVIGESANGCGMTRNAAGGGCSIALAAKTDLAGPSFWAATRQVHSGLRYLNRAQFPLVGDSLTAWTGTERALA